MLGNVGEWCEDVYVDSYQGLPTDGRAYTRPGEGRVSRGGTFNFNDEYCRAPRRNFDAPDYRSPDRGLRLVVVLGDGNAGGLSARPAPREFGLPPSGETAKTARPALNISGKWAVKATFLGQNVDATLEIYQQGADYLLNIRLSDDEDGFATLENVVVNGNQLEGDVVAQDEAFRAEVAKTLRLKIIVQGDTFRGALSNPAEPRAQPMALVGARKEK